MAKVRVMLDVEVSSEELSHKEIGQIANCIRTIADGTEPVWFNDTFKYAKFKPVGVKLWSVERIVEEKQPEEEKEVAGE